MKDFHKREDPIIIPSSCMSLSEELLTLKWVHRSLSETERLPSCERVQALKANLTAMLDSPDIPMGDDILNSLRNAKIEIAQLRKNLEDEQLATRLWDSYEPNIEDFPDSVQQTIKRWLLTFARPYFKKGLVIGLVTGVLVTLSILQLIRNIT